MTVLYTTFRAAASIDRAVDAQRNRGLVHLTPEQIEKRVSYAEIGSLVQSVTVLAECLLPFDPNGVSVRLDEIDDWSNHAKLVWDAAFRTFGKLSD